MPRRFHHGDSVCATEETAPDGVTHYVRIKTATEISEYIRESHFQTTEETE